MGMMPAGYYPSKYFPENYQNDNYWPHRAPVSFDLTILDGVKGGDTHGGVYGINVATIDGINIGDLVSLVLNAAYVEYDLSIADTFQWSEQTSHVFNATFPLLTPGYYPARYFPRRYQVDDYWPSMGESLGYFDLQLVDGIDFGETTNGLLQALVGIVDGITVSDTPLSAVVAAYKVFRRTGQGRFLIFATSELYDFTLTGGLQLSDTLSETFSVLDQVIDGVEISDSLQCFLNLVSLAVEDNLVTSDVLSEAFVALAQILEAVKVSDTSTLDATFSAQIVDVVEFTDAIQSIMSTVLSIADVANLDDLTSLITSAAYSHQMLAEEVVEISDSVDAVVSVLAQVVDTAEFSEILQSTVKMALSTSDAIEFSDLMQAVLAAVAATIADKAEFSETLQSVLSTVLSGLTVTDGADFGEVLQLAFTRALSIVDTAKFSEVLQFIVSTKLTITDVAKFADVITHIFSPEGVFQFTVVDTAEFGDSVLATLGMVVQSLDTIELADTAGADTTFNCSVEDSAQLSDAISALAKFAVAVTDGGKLGDVSTYITVSATAGYEVVVSFTVKGRSVNFVVKPRDKGFYVAPKDKDFTLH